jgi:FtsH-binding integral membrane protein
MFDNTQAKHERRTSKINDTISVSKYNMFIGLVLSYGFVMTGILANMATEFMLGINPIVFLLVYIALAFGGTYLARKSSSPILSFVGYNMIVLPIGALMSLVIPSYDIELIMSAVFTTAGIVLAMMFASMAFPHVFERMGMALGIAFIIAFVAELITMFFGYGGDLFNWIFVVLFSLYIGYDWHIAQIYPKTIDNAIDSALDLYVDIINLFLRILSLMSRSKKR